MQLDTRSQASRGVSLACAIALAVLGSHAQSRPEVALPIHRLDGSLISAREANAFAAKTLAAMRVTGAELAIINHGQHLPLLYMLGICNINMLDQSFDKRGYFSHFCPNISIIS